MEWSGNCQKLKVMCKLNPVTRGVINKASGSRFYCKKRHCSAHGDVINVVMARKSRVWNGLIACIHYILFYYFCLKCLLRLTPEWNCRRICSVISGCFGSYVLLNKSKWWGMIPIHDRQSFRASDSSYDQQKHTAKRPHGSSLCFCPVTIRLLVL